MHRALTRGVNTVAVRLALESSPEAVADVAHRLGVASPIRDDLTIALGSSEVTVLDQAVAYSALARVGEAREPVFIERLVDVRGNEVGLAIRKPPRSSRRRPVVSIKRDTGFLPGRAQFSGPGTWNATISPSSKTGGPSTARWRSTSPSSRESRRSTTWPMPCSRSHSGVGGAIATRGSSQ